jgi:hypothetical protein
LDKWEKLKLREEENLKAKKKPKVKSINKKVEKTE